MFHISITITYVQYHEKLNHPVKSIVSFNHTELYVCIYMYRKGQIVNRLVILQDMYTPADT